MAAESVLDGSFRRGGNSAFLILFGYISGKNQTLVKIDRHPQMIQRKRQKIEMTAPVFSSMNGSSAEEEIYQFVMPARFTLETLPVPSDPRVTLREMPQQVVAVHRFSGCISANDAEAKQQHLTGLLDEHNVQATQTWMLARYDAPYVPCFSRRNEVMVHLVEEAVQL